MVRGEEVGGGAREGQTAIRGPEQAVSSHADQYRAVLAEAGGDADRLDIGICGEWRVVDPNPALSPIRLTNKPERVPAKMVPSDVKSGEMAMLLE